MGYINTQDRGSIYPIWLRFFTFIAAFVAAFILLGPSLLFSGSDSSLPWNEEYRILPQGKTPEINLTENQPQLTRVLRYKTQPQQQDDARGNLSFLIYPDGSIRGVWNGEYDRFVESAAPDANQPAQEMANQTDDYHCIVMAASFNGNVDPSKPFTKCAARLTADGAGSNSNLFFLARGTFTMLETQQSTGHSRSVLGYIYVRGWLYPDYTAVGEIFITENKRSYDAFDWVAQPSN